MGLAASQGRLLLLTARKSDLEFGAQSISQARLVLSREQESVATKYAEAMAATRLEMTLNEENKSVQKNFTAAEFAAAYYDGATGQSTGSYRLTDKNGKPIDIKWHKDTKGNVVIDSIGGDGAASLTKKQKEALMSDKGGSESALKFLMEAGIIKLQKNNGENNQDDWQDASISGELNFREVHDDTNDAKEEATYQANMQRIKVKDQKLELDLKGIETQHKAVETEYESVQKVIQKNIEVSFKIFS